LSKDPAVYLSHILECIDLVETYISGLELADFEEQQQTQDAVLRRIEIIGEAVKNLPEDLREANPTVPWKRIAGTRDKVIHDYLGVDVELIWNVAKNLLPELRAQVQTILASIDAPG
jgi:uncharacterized protein with HEPN domain